MTTVTRGARAVPVVFVLFVWTLTTHGKFSDSGDEPHYLMVAESLFADGDLDVANNYGNGDGRWVGAHTLEAGPHARPNVRGALWSSHDVGLPFLIMPIYAAATRASTLVPEDLLTPFRQTRGLFAYSIVSLSLLALTAWGLVLFMSGLARQVPGNHAAMVTLVLGLSPPVLSHSFLVFPETPAFFAVCLFVWAWCLRPAELTATRLLLVTAAIGSLPWLHRKYSFFALGLAAVLIVRHWAWLQSQSLLLRSALAAAATLPQAALHLWTLNAWGNLGGPQMLDTLPFSAAGTLSGAVGLVFDRERGLLGYAPAYLLLPAWWLLEGRAHRGLLIPVALLYLPMATFSVWSAGFSPAARYLVPLMPLLIAPAAAAASRAAFRAAVIPVLLFQAVVTAIVWQYPRTLWPKELGTNDALRHIPGLGPVYERILPSILTGDHPSAAWMILTLMAAITVAIGVLARIRTNKGSGTGTR
jgi:hypothetical protein